MCDNVRLSNILNVLHACDVELGVHMQTHHFNQHYNSAELRKFNLFGVHAVEYAFAKILWKKNFIKMQYAYIIHPAAMMRCLQKGIWSQSTVIQALPSTARHKIVQSCGLSHNVTISMLAAKMWGFQKVRGKLWETRLEREKVNYLFVFCNERLFLGSASLFPAEVWDYVVSTLSVSQLWCQMKNKDVWVSSWNGRGCHPAGRPNIPKLVAITDDANMEAVC